MHAKTFIYYVLALLFFLGGVSVANAHGTGESFERQVGSYVIDVGYDPATFTTGEPTRFDFGLWNEDKTVAADFKTAWVRIARPGKDVLFTGYLGFPSFGSVGMVYVFADSGPYELTARFENNDGTIAEATIPFTVEEGAKGQQVLSQSGVVSGSIGFLLGAIVVWILRKRSQTPASPTET